MPNLLTVLLFTTLLVITIYGDLSAQRPRRVQPEPQRDPNVTVTSTRDTVTMLVVHTEPRAAVWLNDLRRGTTDDSGSLAIQNVAAGRHTLRVRAQGFREQTVPVLRRGAINVKLLPTTDPAELAFQEAEFARERATNDDERKTVADTYRRAIKLRPRFPQAHLGLARTLLDLNDYDGALAEIDNARRDRPAYAEASAVEGRVQRQLADNPSAIAAYERAIKEGRGRQPEAYTGLGVIYEEKAQHEQAAEAYRKAIAQLQDSEPVVYQLLGSVYERQDKTKEAIAAYEKYLEIAPDGKLAPAVRSILEQLKQGDKALPF